MSPSSGLERCAVLLLAAGLSRRFGEDDKLLASWQGKPLLAWTLAQLSSLSCRVKIAVVGPDNAARVALLESAGFHCVVNPTPEAGMGSSIACGAAFLQDNLPKDMPGLFLCLADMPRVSRTLFELMHASLAGDPGARVVVPVHAGQRGHPVFFARACLPGLAGLAGDTGAKTVVRAAGEGLREVPWEDDSVLLDLDTPADFARASGSAVDGKPSGRDQP